MTATYDPTLDTDRDLVRFTIGDTVPASALFTDEEIDALLLVHTTVLATSIALADALASRYAREASISIDGASFSYGELAEQFNALASRLRARASSAGGGIGLPIVTGVSLDAMRTVDADSDRPRTAFKVGMNDDAGISELDPEPI